MVVQVVNTKKVIKGYYIDFVIRSAKDTNRLPDGYALRGLTWRESMIYTKKDIAELGYRITFK